jgi:hypothetical protein
MPKSAIVDLTRGYKEVAVLGVFCNSLETVNTSNVGVCPPIESAAYGYETAA